MPNLSLKEKMKTMVGYCSSCGTQILDLSKTGKARKLENFAQHTIEVTDIGLLAVGVCVECKVKLVSGKNVKATAEKILANHKIYWSQKETYSPKNADTLELVDPNTAIGKFRKKKRLKEHEDNVKRIEEAKKRKKK